MLLESVNHLLNYNQHKAWQDLPSKKRLQVADSLLTAAEHSLASILTSGKEPTSETLVAKPSILAQVAAVNVYDYVTFPSMSLYYEASDSAAIPKEALQMVGSGKAGFMGYSIFTYKNCF